LVDDVSIDLLIETHKRFAFLRQSLQERGWRPQIGAVLALELLDAVQDILQPYGVGVEHGAAAPGRESVSIQVSDVNVDRAYRDAVLQYSRAFIHQRVDAALDDGFPRNVPPC